MQILRLFVLCLVIVGGHAVAQSAGPSEVVVKRLEDKLTNVCLTLPKDEPPYLSRLSISEVVTSCKCAVPNATKEILEENIHDGGAAYYKVAAHMMICNEVRLKSKLIREKMPKELIAEKEFVFKKTAKERINCLVNQEFEFYLDAYQTLKTPDEKTVLEVVRNCRQ